MNSAIISVRVIVSMESQYLWSYMCLLVCGFGCSDASHDSSDTPACYSSSNPYLMVLILTGCCDAIYWACFHRYHFIPLTLHVLCVFGSHCSTPRHHRSVTVVHFRRARNLLCWQQFRPLAAALKRRPKSAQQVRMHERDCDASIKFKWLSDVSHQANTAMQHLLVLQAQQQRLKRSIIKAVVGGS
jgi:hypothetical protein